MSREIHYCKCGQSIFADMTECGDCVESIVGVIGIDPGPEQSARVLFDGLRVTVADILPNDQLLEILGRGLHVRVPIYCEHIASYGMAVGASVFETCVWIGRFMQVSQQAGSQFSRPWSDAWGYPLAAIRAGAVYVPGPLAGFTVDSENPSYGERVRRDPAQCEKYHEAALRWLQRENIQPYARGIKFGM
jgi:hypothetical protein